MADIYTKIWRDFQLESAKTNKEVDKDHDDNGGEDGKVTDEHPHLQQQQLHQFTSTLSHKVIN